MPDPRDPRNPYPPRPNQPPYRSGDNSPRPLPPRSNDGRSNDGRPIDARPHDGRVGAPGPPNRPPQDSGSGSYRPFPPNDGRPLPPRPIPARPNPTSPTSRPYREPERVDEWQTFNALPMDAAQMGMPGTETNTAPAVEIPTLKAAPWRRRLGAFAVDFGIGLGAAYLAQGVAGLLGSGTAAVDMAGYGAFFATWLINRGYFQSRAQGQSAGKWLFNLKTIDTETETSPSVVRSVAREGVVSLFVLTEALLVPLGADALFALFDPEKRQALHDKAGRTQVVESEEGYQLDVRAAQALEELLQSDAGQEVQEAMARFTKQAKRNSAIANLSDQVGRIKKDLGQNTRSARQQSGKQVKTWVDGVKKTLDNE